jgi:hypothetical protein
MNDLGCCCAGCPHFRHREVVEACDAYKLLERTNQTEPQDANTLIWR